MTNKIFRFFIITSRNFWLVFSMLYIIVILFGNHVWHLDAMDIVGGGTSLIQKAEPIYHFLLRSSGLIEGGKFRGHDTHLNMIGMETLLYPFVSLYLTAWIIYRIYILIKRGRFY